MLLILLFKKVFFNFWCFFLFLSWTLLRSTNAQHHHCCTDVLLVNCKQTCLHRLHTPNPTLCIEKYLRGHKCAFNLLHSTKCWEKVTYQGHTNATNCTVGICRECISCKEFIWLWFVFITLVILRYWSVNIGIVQYITTIIIKHLKVISVCTTTVLASLNRKSHSANRAQFLNVTSATMQHKHWLCKACRQVQYILSMYWIWTGCLVSISIIQPFRKGIYFCDWCEYFLFMSTSMLQIPAVNIQHIYKWTSCDFTFRCLQFSFDFCDLVMALAVDIMQ